MDGIFTRWNCDETSNLYFEWAILLMSQTSIYLPVFTRVIATGHAKVEHVRMGAFIVIKNILIVAFLKHSFMLE